MNAPFYRIPKGRMQFTVYPNGIEKSAELAEKYRRTYPRRRAMIGYSDFKYSEGIACEVEKYELI